MCNISSEVFKIYYEVGNNVTESIIIKNVMTISKDNFANESCAADDNEFNNGKRY